MKTKAENFYIGDKLHATLIIVDDGYIEKHKWFSPEKGLKSINLRLKRTSFVSNDDVNNLMNEWQRHAKKLNKLNDQELKKAASFLKKTNGRGVLHIVV